MKGTSIIERSIVVKKGGLAKIRMVSTTPDLKEELRWLLKPGIIKSLIQEYSNTVKTAIQKKENQAIEKVL
jgi:hypothetical protein